MTAISLIDAESTLLRNAFDQFSKISIQISGFAHADRFVQAGAGGSYQSEILWRYGRSYGIWRQIGSVLRIEFGGEETDMLR